MLMFLLLTPRTAEADKVRHAAWRTDLQHAGGRLNFSKTHGVRSSFVAIFQDEELVYNNIGVLRRFLIALMAFTGLSGISALASDQLFTVHIARSITCGKDVTQI